MNETQLALFGGSPAFNSKVEIFNTIGDEEIAAVVKVMKTGVLSKYIGASGPDFMGGPRVREMEEKFATFFSVKHAIAVNSWTSGLVAAVGAIGVEPGDEIILSPWTMSACAMSILHWNAIPVFADISEQDFCIDPLEVRKKITNKTRAIMAIDIFGQSVHMEKYREIADEFNLKIISDSAQAPGAKYKGKYAGTIADIGGISLNYHKHIHSGEGGVLFTNSDDLARKLCLIRNHGESVVTQAEALEFTNMIGFNFRLGEIEASIAIEQIKKLEKIVSLKESLANQLTDQLLGLKGLVAPSKSENSRNVFYVYPIILDIQKLGVSRSRIVEALRAEGVPGLSEGYQNLHQLPIFQNLRAHGSNGWPWSGQASSEYTYQLGSLPIAEELHNKKFVGLGITGLNFSSDQIALIGNAFRKVWANLDLLK